MELGIYRELMVLYMVGRVLMFALRLMLQRLRYAELILKMIR
jgi:hypothetical protein